MLLIVLYVKPIIKNNIIKVEKRFYNNSNYYFSYLVRYGL